MKLDLGEPVGLGDRFWDSLRGSLGDSLRDRLRERLEEA